MDAKNLTIVFGGVIFEEDKLPKTGDILSIQSAKVGLLYHMCFYFSDILHKDSVMEDPIVYAPLLLSDKSQAAPPQMEPPLPPAPLWTPTPKYDYASSYTKTHILPPRTVENQDFTPTLQPRPEQSIHSSRRVNALPQTARSEASQHHGFDC